MWLRNKLDKINYLRYNYIKETKKEGKLTVRVQKDGIGVNNDGIAVSVVFIANEQIGMRLIRGNDGKIVEPSHARFREDGKQPRTHDDLDIPPGDYKQIFFMAGGILGKKRRKKGPIEINSGPF